MLAGLTQAELLKISPELGNCVGGLEEEADDDNLMSRCEYTIEDREDDKQSDSGLIDSLCYRSVLDGESEDNERKEERKETQKTTSFSEMARRRRRNTAYVSAPYYSTGLSNTSNPKEDDYDMILHYASQRPSSPPPPPPPRPLPPIPSSAPPKISTLPANSTKPERFDWLIAFTPDSDAPPKAPHFEMRKRAVETPKKSSSSSLESSSTGSAPKTTTFKELRNRKSSLLPTKVITDPDPDPNIITPDPDLLYNLKWRRDKAGDGTQWEYTSQAQALFMQPPPALTSMAALQEMLQRAEEENGKSELSPSQNKLGYSVSDSSLWNLGAQWEREEGKMEEERKEGGEVEVRGQADGERTTELRTSASSPSPLPHPRSSPPYFLHSADQSLYPNFGNPFLDARPRNPVGRKAPSNPHMGVWNNAPSSDCVYRHDISTDTNSEYLEDFGIDSICDYRDYELENTQSVYKQTHDPKSIESTNNLDSLYCSNSVKQSTPGAPTCPTPYKNIDAIMRYNNSSEFEKRQLSHRDKAFKELPPLPAFYLYHPKNCPLHRGAPPRLSPIGALSPPQRSGIPPHSGLSSPLFPRSHTLPALAAPLYYPNLYPTLQSRAPPLPPKLYQERSHVATVRSVSFAGHRAEPWMDHDVRAPVRGLGLSPQTLQEKRALVSAVSVAVEAILAQFSTSRTIVQKALSGDSTVNPSLGRLVLQCLCPALHSLLTDGLKPHQSDLIAGRRPNNAWGLVQASTRPGSKTQALFNLQTRVGDLPQLKQSKHRFNAFILGLLNIKHLDFWVSHLHTSSDVLETYYHPSSFMRLSLSACHHQFEELLLVLQPLSLLTFNLDLLFQHHHVDPHPPKTSSVAGQDAAPQVSNQTGEAKKSEEKYMESLSEEDIESGECRNDTTPTPKTEDNSATKEESLLETSPQLRWVKEKEISSLPPPNIEEDSLAQQAGQVIQQGWEVMVRWGGRLSQNLSEMSAATAKKEELKTEHLQTQSDFVPVSSSSNSDSSGGGGVQMPWGLDRLFGAPKSLTSPGTHPGPTRRPSQWLAPGVSVLTRMVSSSTAPMLKKMSEPKEETSAETQEEAEAVETKDQPRPLRSVRTLCDHRGTGSELTFSKGEELQVLGGVDQDWIRCRRGNTEGLVPIGYTSLIM
ncbi:uncharacterized protein LOC117383745 isoform X1 [Periophthalmus magnuspinnatus]|uniref:uncharacterized protein LOC117383745 isoform X1 n=1 Tax=Periophthalmus magnuspinnatus TaxID=409849 RepID=UPI0024367EFF|nr:uncharacterized protein LOC117383745 isoform X1 [Periophthalmus magnuspinnatus]